MTETQPTSTVVRVIAAAVASTWPKTCARVCSFVRCALGLLAREALDSAKNGVEVRLWAEAMPINYLAPPQVC